MSFVFPALAVAGAALAVAPIVIHLINLRRRRRVDWAAMDFLLASSRKNRTWVRLSEWLLLAARVLLVALAGLLAATPQAADLLQGFFGDEPALHAVILDDTASMQRRGEGTTAWDEALAAIDRLARRADDAGDELLVVRVTDTITGFDRLADSKSPIDRGAWRATNAAATAADALRRVAAGFTGASAGGRKHAYLFADYAESVYGDRAEWVEPLRTVAEQSDGVVLAACGDHAPANLAIETLTLAPGPVAAGVEARLVVEIANHSDEPVPTVSVNLRRNGLPLTALRVGPFDPRGRRRVEAPITFSGVGVHTVEAELPSDRLPVDDRRWMVIDVPAAHPVLLVDDSERGVESRVFGAALRPIGKTRSGWAPRRVSDPTADDFADAVAVVLLDVERLSPAAIRNLRDYVNDGGGVLIVTGPRTDSDWFNRALASSAAGRRSFLPWRVGPAASALAPAAGAPALVVEDHSAMRILGGDRNGFLPFVQVRVRRRLAEDAGPRLRNVSTSAGAPEFQALARFVDDAPLVLESRFGEGTVLALLTAPATGAAGAAPWSNLAALPVFPVFANDAVSWLAHRRLEPAAEPIGEARSAPLTNRFGLRRLASDGAMVEASGLGPAAPLSPSVPGVYQRVVGGVESTLFSAVIDPAESRLAAPPLGELQSRWSDIARVARATELFRDRGAPSSRAPLYAVAAALLALLSIERVLSFRNSYVDAAAPARGGAL